jgi:hypothetical protein
MVGLMRRSIAIITGRPRAHRLLAFEYAVANGRRKVTAVHRPTS